MYPPLITPWTHRNHSQTPHSLSIHSAFWKGIVPCFCKNNLATEQDISGKELTLHCSFYVLALSIQKKKSLHYNFCCNISDQLIISSTKWSLKFALWKRNLINNFVELRQHKRYEIRHWEFEWSISIFPIFFLPTILLSLHFEEEKTWHPQRIWRYSNCNSLTTELTCAWGKLR